MNLMANIEGWNFNLLNVCKVYVEALPDMPENYHERKWVGYDTDSIVAVTTGGKKITLDLKKTPKDSNHEWFYGHYKISWWGNIIYYDFKWISEKELEDLPVWKVRVTFAGDEKIRFEARSLKEAFTLRSKIVDKINQIEVGKCKYEPSKLPG